MTASSPARPRKAASAMRTWRWPVFFAALSAAGLASALLGDGVWDAASWFALSAPLVVCAWCGLRRSSPS